MIYKEISINGYLVELATAGLVVVSSEATTGHTNADSIDFRECHLSNSTCSGIAVENGSLGGSTELCATLFVTDCTFYSIVVSGITIAESRYNNFRISGCAFYSCGTGIHEDDNKSGPAWHTHVVERCWFSNIQGMGVEIYQYNADAECGPGFNICHNNFEMCSMSGGGVDCVIVGYATNLYLQGIFQGNHMVWMDGASPVLGRARFLVKPTPTPYGQYRVRGIEPVGADVLYSSLEDWSVPVADQELAFNNGIFGKV